MHRVENLEVLAGFAKQLSTLGGEVLHSCLVLAHEVEQSAHLLRGLLRLPACLNRAESSKSAGVFPQTRWNLSWTPSALVKGSSSVRGLPTLGAGTQDLVQPRTGDDTLQLRRVKTPPLSRRNLGQFEKARN